METDEGNLFGLQNAEYLGDSIVSEYERWVDKTGYEPTLRKENDLSWPDHVAIEEWTATPLRHNMPDAERLVEWITEFTCDDAQEEAYETMCDASTPTVYAAFQKLLDEFGQTLTGWRQANKRIASHLITFDEEGEPMLEGERLYRPAIIEEEEEG